MKKFLILCIAFCSVAVVRAQKVYFIYLQSDNGTPFYIRMGEKVNSSTASGYLILPKLKDSTYNFTVGQPGKKEYQFSLTINKADRGFLIKESGNSLNLFDLQTLTIYNPSSSPISSAIQTSSRTDRFTHLLARAANDTTLLTEVVYVESAPLKKNQAAEPAVAKEEVQPKADSVTESATVSIPSVDIPETNQLKDSAVASVATAPNTDALHKEDTTATAAAAVQNDTAITNAPTVEEPKQEPIAAEGKENKETVPVTEEEFTKSVVVKRSESSTSDGFGLVFLDSYNGQVDTIQLTIPNPQFLFADSNQKQGDGKEFLEISTQAAAKAPDESKQESIVKSKPACVSQANDDDFFKLRRDMAAEKEEDEMIAQAKKYFKSKCFRSEQIKYLSNLFLTDSGKYHFFDVAYFHVSDQDKFTNLQSELKDTYYVNRFKTLVAY